MHDGIGHMVPPWSDTPLGSHPRADTPRYGQWAGGTHPTRMHSCLFLQSWRQTSIEIVAFAFTQCKQTHIRGTNVIKWPSGGKCGVQWSVALLQGLIWRNRPSDPPPNNPHHHDSHNLSAKNKTFFRRNFGIFFFNFPMKINWKLLPT